MVDLSAEPVKENIDTTVEIFERVIKMKQFLEMEIGITGGEEDGVNHEKADKSSMSTQPETVYQIYEKLSKDNRDHPYFTIAAAFGNVHGVYSDGSVELEPKKLKDYQAYVKKEAKLEDDKPVFLVFHGGSGSSEEHFKEAISYGVVKVVSHAMENKRKKERKKERKKRRG